jgi:DNA (cytosine-5)-methyltransferase 1
MARVIGEVQPQYAFIENSPMLTRRGLESVLCDLAKMGFNAEWGCISASDFGANHERERIWIVAANTNLPQFQRRGIPSGIHKKNSKFSNSHWWKNSSNVHRMDDGVAARVDRLKAVGNGQVPQVAAVAWNLLNERFT